VVLRLILKDKNNKMVYRASKRKTTAWSRFIEAKFLQFKPFSVKLVIEYRKGWTNSGVYYSLKEIKKAYRAFSDKSLINYAKGVI